MINVEIQGKFPNINADLTPAMSRIADRMLWSFGQSHENQGYGRWVPTREGKPATLAGLRKTERTSYGTDFAEIRWMGTIHQNGGIMVQTPRQKSFFWAKWYETDEDKWKWMALSKRPMVFPPRPLTLQAEDIDLFKKELVNHIFNITEGRNAN
jgi:hypothetical protein